MKSAHRKAADIMDWLARSEEREKADVLKVQMRHAKLRTEKVQGLDTETNDALMALQGITS